MGYQLVQRAMAGWSHLPPNAHKVLLRMASTALDDEGMYYGGWERLALGGLGRMQWPAEGDTSVEALKARRAHARRVEQAITDLLRAGAVERIVRGGNGRRAVYRLTLHAPVVPLAPVDSGVDKPSTGGKLSDGFVSSSPTADVGQLPSSPTDSVGPRNKSLGTRRGTKSSTSPRHLRGVG